MTKVYLIKLIIIIVISFICTLQDLKRKKVHNYVIFLGYILLALFYIIFNIENLPSALLSAFLSGTVFLVGKLLLKDKLGMADVLFSIFIGLALPYQFCLIALAIAIILGAGGFFVKGFALRLEGGRANESLKSIKLPFIPFLSAGLIISYVLSII